MEPSLFDQIDSHGFAFVRQLASPATIERLKQAVRPLGESTSARTRRGSLYGIRNLLQLVPEIRDWAESPEVLDPICAVLGPDAKPVKGILFDKTPEANWAVPWHQDLTIATQSRIDFPGFTTWSEKDGIPHVQPPAEIMEQILALRLHLDDCPEANGALRVISGSHKHGRLDSAQTNSIREQSTETLCEAFAGDALLMRPLLLHASSSSIIPGHRRVVHLEFTAIELPGGLMWGG